MKVVLSRCPEKCPSCPEIPVGPLLRRGQCTAEHLGPLADMPEHVHFCASCELRWQVRGPESVPDWDHAEDDRLLAAAVARASQVRELCAAHAAVREFVSEYYAADLEEAGRTTLTREPKDALADLARAVCVACDTLSGDLGRFLEHGSEPGGEGAKKRSP